MLGVGNILFGDEGIGVHLAHFLKTNYAFESSEHSLEIVDGGTLAQHLIPLITAFDRVLLLDCINADDGEIGDVFCFDFADIPPNLNHQGSAHEVEMLHTLRLIEALGDLPPIKIIATIPEIINDDASFSLSPKMLRSAAIMCDSALQFLRDLGFSVRKIADIPLQEIAKNAWRG